MQKNAQFQNLFQFNDHLTVQIIKVTGTSFEKLSLHIFKAVYYGDWCNEDLLHKVGLSQIYY